MDSILRLYESKTGLSSKRPSEGAFGILILVDSKVFGISDNGVPVRTHIMAIAINLEVNKLLEIRDRERTYRSFYVFDVA